MPRQNGSFAASSGVFSGIDKTILKPVAMGRATAELGSFVAATGVVPLVEKVAPHQYDKLKEHVASSFVAPRLDWFEHHMLRLPAFAHAAREIRTSEDDTKKASAIASALVDFLTMTVGSVIGQGITQGVANHISGLSFPHEAGSSGLKRSAQQLKRLAVPILFERATNVGVIGLLQLRVPQQTEKVTNATADFLQKTIGLPPAATTFLLQWKLAELPGAALNSLLMTRSYQNAGLHTAGR